MKDFLTDFYNKVINFFQQEKVEGENTKETAKNRLKLVLMQDRSNLEPETMAQLREELIEVISKYIVIDKEALGLNLDGDGESMALMLNIPVIRAKKPEEIREALEAAKAKAAEELEVAKDEEAEGSEDETETTVVEFSEGSIEELDLSCDGDCNCGCQDGIPCACSELNAGTEAVEVSDALKDSSDKIIVELEAGDETEVAETVGSEETESKKSKQNNNK